MSRIKGKDTKLEITVRKALWNEGYRYYKHGKHIRGSDKNLPGKPDIVLTKYHAVIFVNGCFWHVHDCHFFKWPASRKKFWIEKLTRTTERDMGNIEVLNEAGWRVLTVWECAVRGRTSYTLEEIVVMIEAWIASDSQRAEISGKTEKKSK